MVLKADNSLVKPDHQPSLAQRFVSRYTARPTITAFQCLPLCQLSSGRHRLTAVTTINALHYNSDDHLTTADRHRRTLYSRCAFPINAPGQHSVLVIPVQAPYPATCDSALCTHPSDSQPGKSVPWYCDTQTPVRVFWPG